MYQHFFWQNKTGIKKKQLEGNFDNYKMVLNISLKNISFKIASYNWCKNVKKKSEKVQFLLQIYFLTQLKFKIKIKSKIASYIN